MKKERYVSYKKTNSGFYFVRWMFQSEILFPEQARTTNSTKKAPNCTKKPEIALEIPRLVLGVHAGVVPGTKQEVLD